MIKFDKDFALIRTKEFLLELKKNNNQLYINKIGHKDTNHIIDNKEPSNLIMTLPNMTFSYYGECDYRESLFYAHYEDGSFSDHFVFTYFEKENNVNNKWPLPKNIKEYLVINYVNERDTISIKHYLGIDEVNNTVASFYKVINKKEKSLLVNRLMSLQLDFDDDGYSFYTFNGKWGDERNITVHQEEIGTFINESKSGASSAQSHPGIIFFKNNDYYLFNLIFSGNHKEIIHNSHLHTTRVLIGANDFMMNIHLGVGEEFITPCATLTYGKSLNDLSLSSQAFINSNIRYDDGVFPLIFNSWEAEEFNLNKSNWPSLAKKAKELGIDTFVFDDGWFGVNRNDTDHDIGDWTWNEKKMGSIPFVKKTLNELGLKFGLWIEPESLSPLSNVWDEMKKFALIKEGDTPVLLRGTYALDYSNKELRDYLFNKLERSLATYKPDYVKWDYNRSIVDIGLKNKNYGSFYFDYVEGFYDLINRLRKRFPNIIFEGCSSGGNRFDSGALYYFGSIWTSDCTDARKRITIQENTALMYPLKSMTNHISASPNQQTNKKSSIHDRINVALFGQMGVEQNLSNIDEYELNNIKEAFKFYNQYKDLILNGEYYFSNIFNPLHTWTVVDKAKDHAIALLIKLVDKKDKLTLVGLDENKHYNVVSRHQDNASDIVINNISGKELMEEGIEVKDSYLESDKEDNEINISTRVLVINSI